MIDAVLREAWDALAHDSRGDLPLPIRQKIWAALGSRSARARLAIAAARHVLPEWEAQWPNNRLPQHLLELAERVLGGGVDPATIHRERESAYVALDELWYH